MTQLPQFSTIDVENVPAQLTKLLDTQRHAIDELLKQPNFSWESLMQPLDDMDDTLHQFWSPVSHLHSVVNNDALRGAYSQCLPQLSDFGTELGQNKPLFEAIKSLNANNPTEEKIIEDELIGFKLSGVALEGDNKKRFGEIQKRLSELSNHYENNILDATNAWKKVINDEKRLAGLPEHAINTAKSLSEQENEWVLTLDFPCFHAVMAYADDRALREEMYLAFVTRASDLGPDQGAFDNGPLIAETLALRHEKALLLGFNNYAELSIARKMAPSTKKVMEFLIELAQKSKTQAEEEYSSLKAFAGLSDFKSWDIAYYSEKQRQALFEISQETLRAYFPETRCMQGMFDIAGKLYGLQFEQVENFDSWYPDVTLYKILDENKKLRGELYVDLYARPHKRSGAWMDDCVSYRRLTNGEIQTPVAFLTCNFAKATKGEESYLSHGEVETLFHEFGHCLHHLLTKVEYAAVSGINGVEWDAVELPSQFFENWCWDKQALALLTQHKETGEPLPDELFEKMLAAKNFQSAMGMLRQLEFSLFDFDIHLNYQQSTPVDVMDSLSAIRKQYSVIPYPEFNRFPHGFSHIFAGGYAAGYYSYKWAEVLSSDAFSRFEEEGIFNEKTGRDFLHQILEVGGSRKALDSFIAFRGREPSVDPLLRHNGIETNA